MTWNQHMRNNLKHFKSRGLIEIYFLPIPWSDKWLRWAWRQRNISRKLRIEMFHFMIIFTFTIRRNTNISENHHMNKSISLLQFNTWPLMLSTTQSIFTTTVKMMISKLQISKEEYWNFFWGKSHSFITPYY